MMQMGIYKMLCMSDVRGGYNTHRKVAAGRSSVSCQMASVFLIDNISLFANFACAEDVITTSHSK